MIILCSTGCSRPSAAAAWRKSPPQNLWCVLWSASTTSTASAAACATASWGRATSLSWRRVSCCARSTTRGRRTYSAQSARMTQTQVSSLHPLTEGWEQRRGATITWHQGVVFCVLCSITAVANTDNLRDVLKQNVLFIYKKRPALFLLPNCCCWDICQFLEILHAAEAVKTPHTAPSAVFFSFNGWFRSILIQAGGIGLWYSRKWKQDQAKPRHINGFPCVGRLWCWKEINHCIAVSDRGIWDLSAESLSLRSYQL